jgi:hypothetical protein
MFSATVALEWTGCCNRTAINGDQPEELGDLQISQVDAVPFDAAGVGVVEPAEGLDKRALTRAAGPR